MTAAWIIWLDYQRIVADWRYQRAKREASG